MRSLRAAIGFVVAALAALPGFASVQTTWSGASSASWSDSGNWSTGVPAAGDTAQFNGASSNRSVDLGGAARPVGTISFDTAGAAAYTFSGNAGDAFVFDAGGGVSSSTTVTTGQTFNSAIQNLGALNIANNTTGTAAPLTFSGAFSLAPGGSAGALAVTAGTGPVVISGSFGNNFSAITKSGTGNLTLSGTNTAFTGNITINTGGGTILVGSSDALGSAGTVQLNAGVLSLQGVTTNAGKTLLFNNAGQLINNGVSSTWSGGIVIQGTAGVTITPTNNSSSSLTINGNITAGASDYTGQLLIRGNNATAQTTEVCNGTITLPNATVSKTDNGTWILNSTGNSWAKTTLAVGTIQIGANNALPTGVALTMGQNGGSAAVLELNGFNQTVGSLINGGGTPSGGKVTNSNNTTVSQFTVNQATASTYTQAIAGNLALIKTGAGTLTLSASNATIAPTYTGGTSVLGGTLLVSNTVGSGTGTGLVSVTGTGALGSGGTVGGTGSISGGVAVGSTTAANQGGTLSPGAAAGSVGKLTVSGAASAFSPVGTYAFDYNASATGAADTTTSDFLSGTGSATLDLSTLGTAAGGKFNVLLNATNIPGSLPGSPVTYTLATFAGGVTAPANIVGSDLTPYFTFSGAFQTAPTAALSGNSVLVTFTPVPEPASALLLFAAAAIVPTFRRRRRTSGH